MSIVYSAYITRNGVRLWAKDYGRKAWCFEVKDKDEKKAEGKAECKDEDKE